MEKLDNQVYSLHRYENDDGTPNYPKIFCEGESKLWVRRHLDPNLLRIFDSQPEIIRMDKIIKRHLVECRECGSKYNSNKGGKEYHQGKLPFSENE